MTSQQLFKGYISVLLFCITHLANVCSATASTNTLGVPDRSPGAFLEFDFLRSDCLSGRFFSANTSSVVPQVDEITLLTGGTCLAHNGLSSTPTSTSISTPAAASSAPLTTLLNALENTTTMTFSFWILPPPQLPTQSGPTGSLLSFEYDKAEVSCGFSLELYEQGQAGARRAAAVLCQSDGSTIQLAEGTTYADQWDNSSMRYVVVTFQFKEQLYPGLGTVNSVFSNSSYDSAPHSLTSQKDHSINKGSMHPSAFQASSAPHLTLLPARSGSAGAGWGGQLLQLSLYPRLLSSEEVAHNYLAGLHNSLPISWNLTVRVREDVLSNVSLPVLDADNQAWHANYQLHCATNQSNAPDNNNATHGVCSKMIVRLLRPPEYGDLFLVRGDGSDPILLTKNDVIEYTPSTTADIMEPSMSGNNHYVVHYQPLLNQHSASSSTQFDSFDIQAVDGWTAEVSGESTVAIIVTPVDDPPVALDGSAVLYARQCVVLPALEGTDAADAPTAAGGSGGGADSSHHSVQRAVVFTLPRNGTLHQVNADLSLDSAPLATPTVHGTDLRTPFTVGYCYSGAESEVEYTLEGGGAVIGTDGFTFGVVGSSNVSSSAAVVRLQVLSQLEGVGGGANLTAASGRSAGLPVEGTLSNLTLFGKVIFDVALNSPAEILTVRIVEDPKNGSLYDLATGHELIAGSVVSSAGMEAVDSEPGVFSITVGYESEPVFFTHPTAAWYGDPVHTVPPLDSISYEVITISNTTKRVIAVSSPVEQLIEVRNRNDPTEIEFTFQTTEDAARGYYEVYAWSATDSSEAGVGRHQRMATTRAWRSTSTTATTTSDAPTNDAAGSYIAMDNTFTLTDLDQGTDLIRAHVVSTNGQGLITLNTEFLNLVDFNSATYCSSSEHWVCDGDGYNEEEMVFLGTPRNISRVLNGLQYLSLTPHHTDWVNITLYDGAEGECLPEASLLHGRSADSTTLRDECFVTSVAIEVRVMGVFEFIGEEDDDSSGAGSAGRALWATRLLQVGVCVAALALLYCVCTPCLWCARKARRRCRQSKDKASTGMTLGTPCGDTSRQQTLSDDTDHNTNNKNKKQKRKRRKNKTPPEDIWKAVQQQEEETKRNDHDDDDEDNIVYYENNRNFNYSVQMTGTHNNDNTIDQQQEKRHNVNDDSCV
jgi:hypothetical protein